MGRLRPSCHRIRGNPSTSWRLVMDSTRLDSTASSRSAHDTPPRASRSSQIRNDHVCFILARPSYDLSLAEVPICCHPAPPNLHMLLSSTHTLTRTSHLISIGPDQACLEASEPPPSCTPISHTSGTISKEQAPFRPDCLLSCLPTHGPQRIGFRLRLRHTFLSNHVPPRSMVRDWCVCPQAARAVTAHRLQQGLCLHQRGVQGLDQAATRENALSSPSPFGRCWALHIDDTSTSPRPNGLAFNHGARELFQGRCESRNPALYLQYNPRASIRGENCQLCIPPHGRLRDLPLAGSHCDARPAFAASEICLINVTPILCPLIPSDFR